jgi:hypothetical protein
MDTTRSQLLHETLADKHTSPSPPPSKDTTTTTSTTTISTTSLLPVRSDPLQNSPPPSPPLSKNTFLPHPVASVSQLQQPAPLTSGDPMLQVHNTSHHSDLNGFLNNLTAKNTDRPGLIPGPGIDRRNVILSSSTSVSSPIAPVSPFHQTKKDNEDLMHHPLGVTADHGPPPDNLDHDDVTTTLRRVSNNTPERIYHRQQQQDDSRPATRVASGLVLGHDPLFTDNNNYNTNTRIEGSSDCSNDTINDLTHTTSKAKPSHTSRKQEAAAFGTLESSQQPPQPTERAVASSIDPLLEPVDSDRRPHLSSSSRRSPTAPSLSISSNRRTAKQSPLGHLPDMGPLEIGRGIDSGVVLNQDMPSHPSVNNVRRILTSDSMSDPFLRDPSTSTLVSGFSTLSSNTTLTGQGRPDTDHGTESSSWSGDHPLLFDYTAEPDSIDDDSYPSHRISSSHPHGYLAVSRHKGHTLSLGTTQEPTQLQDSEISFFASGSKTRRRRNGPKGAEERSWTSHTDKDKDQKQNGGLEPGGKRVIIHQVTTTDTLAGIALNYGIQVSVKGDIHTNAKSDLVCIRTSTSNADISCVCTIGVDSEKMQQAMDQRLHSHSKIPIYTL